MRIPAKKPAGIRPDNFEASGCLNAGKR